MGTEGSTGSLTGEEVMQDTLMATSRRNGNEPEYVEIYLARNGRAYLIHTDTLKNTRQRHKMSLEQQRYVIMNWKAATRPETLKKGNTRALPEQRTRL